MLIPLMLALLLPTTAIAHDFEVDGIYFNITIGDVTLIIDMLLYGN